MIKKIMAIALVVRLISLNQSLWLDEAVQVWASKLPLTSYFNNFLATDFNPPLYYLFIHYWIKLAGNSEIAVRLPSVMFGVISIFVFYKIINLIKISDTSKKLSILLLATSPLHVYYSQEARPYILASLGFLISIYSLLKLKREENGQNFALLIFGLVISFFSHYMTILALPFFLYYLLKLYRINRSRKYVYLLGFIFIIFFILYLPILNKQLGVSSHFFEKYPIWNKVIGGFGLKEIALLFIKFISGRVGFDNKIVYVMVNGISCLFFWGLFALGLKNQKGEAKYFNFLFAGIFSLALLLSLKIHIFSYFRLFFLLPIFYLGIGLGFQTLSKSWQKLAAPGLILINLIFLSLYLFFPSNQRENWKKALAFTQNEKPNQVLIMSQVSKAYEYYDSNKLNYYLIANPDYFTDTALRNNNRIALFSYGLPIFDPQDKIRKKLNKSNYKLIKGDSFNQVGVEIWEK
jgi:uncharacterized membrane protein